MAEVLQNGINDHVTPDSYYKYVCSFDSDVKKINAFGEENGVLHAPHNMEDIKRVSTTKQQKRVSSEGEQ